MSGARDRGFAPWNVFGDASVKGVNPSSPALPEAVLEPECICCTLLSVKLDNDDNDDNDDDVDEMLPLSPVRNLLRSITDDPELLAMDCIADTKVSIFPSSCAIRKSDSSAL
jgi:hypothetical protein